MEVLVVILLALVIILALIVRNGRKNVYQGHDHEEPWRR
jgi:hypothetical protein